MTLVQPALKRAVQRALEKALQPATSSKDLEVFRVPDGELLEVSPRLGAELSAVIAQLLQIAGRNAAKEQLAQLGGPHSLGAAFFPAPFVPPATTTGAGLAVQTKPFSALVLRRAAPAANRAGTLVLRSVVCVGS